MTNFITTPLCANQHPEKVLNVVATLFSYLAFYVKHSVSPEPYALHRLDKPEPACQHLIVLSDINLFT